MNPFLGAFLKIIDILWFLEKKRAHKLGLRTFE